MIPITKPFLPPRDEFEELVKDIWQRNWLTNNGPMVKDLEKQLCQFLELKNLLFVTNGTIAIQLALKALGINKEVITTPLSYVATTSSLVWEGCTPVFVDIDPDSLNIDPKKIVDAITPDTEAILATHCFGNPCDVVAIARIAEKHQLKVIYDAAHCFGTEYEGRSIFEWGDVSTCSFHATKLFHTVEGGAVISNCDRLTYRLSRMRNFGHSGYEEFDGVGINGKNSEYHAAMGLCLLKYIKKIIRLRREQCVNYDELLKDTSLKKIHISNKTKWNYAYYPVIFENEDVTLQVKELLEKWDIYPRRYFYPSLDSLEYVKSKKMPLADDISKRILCLPLFHNLSYSDQCRIAEIITDCLS